MIDTDTPDIPFRLDGYRVVVAGGSRGIGRSMALAFAQAGAGVSVCARGESALTEVAQAIRAQGVVTHTQSCDLADGAAIDDYIAAAARALGGIDVLVNNAGIGQSSERADQRRAPIRFWEVTQEQWSRFVAVNATAPIMMARAVLPHMLQAKRGRIITVTTSLGTMVRGGYLLYGASKAAAEAAMAGLSADLDGTGVTSNVLVPGGVTNTPLVGGDAGDRDRMLQPEIMVPPLLWLVSDTASVVNGRRFIAADWDSALPPEQAAEKAGAPIAWMSIARMPIEP